MNKLLILLCTILFGINAARAEVELTLSSPLIQQDGIAVDLTPTPIGMDNPCSFLDLTPSSCSYDDTLKQITVTYDMDVTPVIPAGEKGVLNLDIQNTPGTGFEQVRILDNGIPVLSQLEFINNTPRSYEIEFKIKINGEGVIQTPEVSIDFLLEQQFL